MVGFSQDVAKVSNVDAFLLCGKEGMVTLLLQGIGGCSDGACFKGASSESASEGMGDGATEGALDGSNEGAIRGGGVGATKIGTGGAMEGAIDGLPIALVSGTLVC